MTASEVAVDTALDEAAALGAPCLVLVPGGLPAGDRDLSRARGRAADAIEALVPHALDVAGVARGGHEGGEAGEVDVPVTHHPAREQRVGR